MSLSIHHIAIAVRDLEAALAFYRDALGLEMTERRVVPQEGVEIAFLPVGESEIELLRPLDEGSPVARFLEKRGEGLHHICVRVDDIVAAMERLKAAGATLLSDEPRVGADGTRYVFIHPKSAHGVLLELYEKRSDSEGPAADVRPAPTVSQGDVGRSTKAWAFFGKGMRVVATLTMLLIGVLGCAGEMTPVSSPNLFSVPSPAALEGDPSSKPVTFTPIPSPSPTVRATLTAPPSPSPEITATPTPRPIPRAGATPSPTLSPTPEVVFAPPPGREFATLDDFWEGNAEWFLEEFETGLPMGESDTVYRGGMEFWSYLHASFASAGVRDSCGDPVPFPGCVTLWKSTDGGRRFVLEKPVCLFPCRKCPCDHWRDHVRQQQYPRVFFDVERVYMVYETDGAVYLRISSDGLRWTEAAPIPETGWLQQCSRPEERVGTHPYVPNEAEYGRCLVGAPPGIYAEGSRLYVFVALGRSPGHMGCLVGHKLSGAAGLRRCASNPLFGAESDYGPLDLLGPAANPYFEFRTISSADVVRVGQRYYMVYEGVRGPGPGDPGDNQFGLGLARSVGPEIDGPWEKYPGNPILMDLPGNIGVGHADLLIVGPATYLYTATSSTTRGRYVLVRK